jgi:hypothetical protein
VISGGHGGILTTVVPTQETSVREQDLSILETFKLPVRPPEGEMLSPALGHMALIVQKHCHHRHLEKEIRAPQDHVSTGSSSIEFNVECT